MSNLNSTKDLKRTLGFWDLMGAAVGQIIGAGIMSLTGVAIAMTGRSVPFAFILSAVLVIISWYPLAIICTTGRFRGGLYSIVGTLLGPKYTGVFTFIFVLSNVSVAMYCLSFADYALPFLPMFSKKALSLGLLVIIYLINCKGIDKFAKFQNIIIALLTAALTIFTVYGFSKISPNYFSEDTFFTNGILGFAKATALLTFATGGSFVVANLSAEAKNPAKDIPKVIISSTIIVGIFYGFMASVAAGVLPINIVAGQSLVTVAKEILPGPLYAYFIIGGAWSALISTLNAQFASATKPLMQAATDGWFPSKIATLHKTNRTPIYLITFYFILGILPIVFNYDIGTIGALSTLTSGLMGMLVILSLKQLPKKYPKQWEKSPLKISKIKLYLLTTFALLIMILQTTLLAVDLSFNLILGNVAVLIFAIIFSNVRYNSGKVKLENSFEFDDEISEELEDENKTEYEGVF